MRRSALTRSRRSAVAFAAALSALVAVAPATAERSAESISGRGPDASRGRGGERAETAGANGRGHTESTEPVHPWTRPGRTVSGEPASVVRTARISRGSTSVASSRAIPSVAAPDTGAQVTVGDNFFSPAEVTVEPNGVVRWTHAGDDLHSITADDGTFDSHPNCPPVCLTSGASFEVSFTGSGTHAYRCRIHGAGMAGVVVVASGGADALVREAGGKLPVTGLALGPLALAGAGAIGAGRRLRGALRRIGES